MNRGLIGVLLVWVVGGFGLGCEQRPAGNTDAASETMNQTWDAVSARHIDALSARMTAAQGLSVVVTRAETQTAFGVEKKSTAIHRLSVDRPKGRLALVCDRAVHDTDGSVLSDGDQMVLAQHRSGRYSMYSSPGMDAILTSREFAVLGGSAGWFASMLLAEDPKAAFAYGLDHAEGVRDDKVGNESAEQIRFVGYESSYDIWFDAKQAGLPTRVRFEGETDEGTQITELHFSDWRFEKPDESEFVFKPSNPMTKVSTLFETEAHPLLNQPAPDFELKDASGQVVKLSSLRGRVVVLDFGRLGAGRA